MQERAAVENSCTKNVFHLRNKSLVMTQAVVKQCGSVRKCFTTLVTAVLFSDEFWHGETMWICAKMFCHTGRRGTVYLSRVF